MAFALSDKFDVHVDDKILQRRDGAVQNRKSILTSYG